MKKNHPELLIRDDNAAGMPQDASKTVSVLEESVPTQGEIKPQEEANTGATSIQIEYVKPEPKEPVHYQVVYSQTKREVVREQEEKKKMLNLNITGYVDYLQTMAGYRHMTMTKYIRELIAVDADMNREIYGKIKSI